MTVKWILLDIDDTLIDYTSAHQVAFEEMIRLVHQHTSIPITKLQEIYTTVKKNVYDRYPGQYNRHDKLLQIKLFCNELNIRSILLVSQIYNHYESIYLEKIQCFEDVLPFFEYCQKRGIQIILMTNNLLPIQLKIFEKFQFEKYVQTMYTSHEFLYEKPHSESLEYILNKFQIQPTEAIVIGDSQSDIKWGESFGIKSLLCDPKKNGLMSLIQHLS
jgi:phosphoglycolate phosphatase